jgi:hypothetical protein
MSRTGEQWIEMTGGFRIDEPLSFNPGMHSKMIAWLELRLASGKLRDDERERVLAQIRKLKGILPPEFDYDIPDDDD